MQEVVHIDFSQLIDQRPKELSTEIEAAYLEQPNLSYIL